MIGEVHPVPLLTPKGYANFRQRFNRRVAGLDHHIETVAPDFYVIPVNRQ
jgi:hypothetical protein